MFLSEQYSSYIDEENKRRNKQVWLQCGGHPYVVKTCMSLNCFWFVIIEQQIDASLGVFILRNEESRSHFYTVLPRKVNIIFIYK